MTKEQESPEANAESVLQSEVRLHKWKWSLPFLAAFLPIVLLSFYSFQLSSDSVRSLVEEENVSASESLAQLLVQDVQQNVKLAHAVASIPGTISAVEQKDELVMRSRLKGIMVSNAKLHRAFVVDPEGTLWSEFPTAEGLYGSSFKDWEWFQEVKKYKRPYISGLYLRSQFLDKPVVAIATPILSGDTFLGILVFEYQVDHISKWLENIRLGANGNLLLLDQDGALVAHPNINIGYTINKSYTDIDVIKKAHEGMLQTNEYTDPTVNKEMVATFLPISMGGHLWVIVAQQPKEDAFALLNEIKRNLSVVGGLMTFLTLVMIATLARISAKNIILNKTLEEKNQALKDFTSIVSHQLKAPITAMRWNIESVLDGDYGEISEELRDLMKTLHSVNISNYHLIMDILNVSRLDRGVVTIVRHAVSLRDVAERAIRDYVPAAEKAGLTLKIDEKQKDIMVLADLEKTAESITNSISNAIKYTKQGGITVTLSQEDGMGVIRVTDTGDGMSEEMMANLFSRSGVKKSNTSAESSSGLGLFIAKNFMQLQKGDIAVSSELGKGTTFTYTLQIATDEDIAKESKKEEESHKDAPKE